MLIRAQITGREISRFWSKVDFDGPQMRPGIEPCWNWRAAKDAKWGYGYYGIKRVIFKSHRVAFVIENGDIPNGMCVLHTCDNPSCVRPSHLWLGTRADNNRDMIMKGRAVVLRGENHPFHQKPWLCARGDKNGARLHPEKLPRGEGHKSAKLTNQTVAAIRSGIAAGETATSLAIALGVNRTTVSSVVQRKTWRHL